MPIVQQKGEPSPTIAKKPMAKVETSAYKALHCPIKYIKVHIHAKFLGNMNVHLYLFLQFYSPSSRHSEPLCSVLVSDKTKTLHMDPMDLL